MKMPRVVRLSSKHASEGVKDIKSHPGALFCFSLPPLTITHHHRLPLTITHHHRLPLTITPTTDYH